VKLTRELLLPYQGLNGFDGLCHVRVYEDPGRLPVAIAGGLTDNPGTSITNAAEMVAAAIQRSIFTDGREFHLVEHYPSPLPVGDRPTFALIHFSHRSIHEDPDNTEHYAGNIVILAEDEATAARGPEIEGDFREPRREPIDDIQALLGCEVQTWPEDQYAAHTIAGEPGEQLRHQLASQARRRSEEIVDAVEDDG
jgi:hypothetical protein